MKLFSKFLFLSLALFATFALTSCGDDDESSCSNCGAYTLSEGGFEIDFPALNVCVGDDDGVGGTFTQAQIDALTASAEAGGASCN